MDTVAKIEMVITGDAKWSKYSQFDRNLKWNLNNSLNIGANYLCVSSSHRNVKCGSLQCKDGDRQPSSVNGIDITNSKTTIGVKGVEYECKWVNKKTHIYCDFHRKEHSIIKTDGLCSRIHRATSGPAPARDYTEDGLVRDGSPCGKDLVCVNQSCVSIFPYIDQTRCPTNGNNVECFGQGVSQIVLYLNEIAFRIIQNDLSLLK